MLPILFRNPIPCLAGHAKLFCGVRDRENAFLNLFVKNVKEVAVILGWLAAFPVIGALASNLLALSGAFNNHVTLKLCKGKKHREDQIAGERILDKPFLMPVEDSMTITVQILEKTLEQ